MKRFEDMRACVPHLLSPLKLNLVIGRRGDLLGLKGQICLRMKRGHMDNQVRGEFCFSAGETFEDMHDQGENMSLKESDTFGSNEQTRS